MTDLTTLNDLAGDDLTAEQIRGLLNQCDLNIANLLREGKLAALKYTAGDGGLAADRAANLQALLATRQYYERLLSRRTAWELSQYDDGTL